MQALVEIGHNVIGKGFAVRKPALAIERQRRFEARPAAGFEGVTCSPDCYQSEVESGSFMMVV
jgi:hypothetical protein